MLEMGFALIILFCGLYILYAAIQMKNDRKINTSVGRTPKNVGRKVHDVDHYIKALYPRMIALALFSIGISFWFFMSDQIEEAFGAVFDNVAEAILVALYLIGLVVYTNGVKKLENRHCER